MFKKAEKTERKDVEHIGNQSSIRAPVSSQCPECRSPPVPVAGGLRWSLLRVPMSAVHRAAVSSVKDRTQ